MSEYEEHINVMLSSLRRRVGQLEWSNEELRSDMQEQIDKLHAELKMIHTLLDRNSSKLLEAAKKSKSHAIENPERKSETTRQLGAQIHARWYIALRDFASLKQISMAELLRQILLDWLEEKDTDVDFEFPMPEKRTKARGISDLVQTFAISTSVPVSVMEKIDLLADKGWHKYSLGRYGLRGTRSTVLRAALGDWLRENDLVDISTFPQTYRIMELTNEL